MLKYKLLKALARKRVFSFSERKLKVLQIHAYIDNTTVAGIFDDVT